MNNVVLMGRLTRDADIRISNQENEQKTIARFTLAVDRIKEGADFISCVAFGNTAEVIEKYVSKGTKILISGKIQTGSYKNKDGNTVYTTDVIVNNLEFAESKKESQSSDDFINIAEVEGEEGLPF